MALTDDQIQKIRLLISSSGWNDVMKPVLANRANAALKALVLTQSERATDGGEFKAWDDESLRAAIREIEWMLVVWTNMISVHEHNRVRDELDRANQSPNGT